MALFLNEISSAVGSRKAKQRVGRGIGSGLGKTAGRGHKGVTSRTGGGVAPGFEGGQMPLHRRLPKFGFVSLKALNHSEVRTSELAKIKTDVVTLQTLKDANIINSSIKRVKLVLSGKVTRSFVLKGIPATKGAREAVEAAGGKLED